VKQQYYNLVGGLPYLEHFESATHLPVTRLRLDSQLHSLTPEHYAQLQRAEDLVVWERQPVTRTDAEMIVEVQRGLDAISDPGLHDFVEWRLDQRTVIVGLRRKQLSLAVPNADDAWGVGRFRRWIIEHWDDADFRLTAVFPWIPNVRESLASDNALEIERTWMNVVWQRLSRVADEEPFGFAAVFAFVFKWDILKRWLSYDAQAGKERFVELLKEVIGEHQRFFA
jgi:hypothetical protein